MATISQRLAALERSDYQSAYYRRNRERKLAAAKANYASKQEEIAARKKADPWRRSRIAHQHARQAAREYGLDPGILAKEDFARLHLLPCAYCGTMPAMGVDHIVALSANGPNSIENLDPSCLRCNQRKSGPRRHRQTHCLNGHPFDEANTYVWGNQRVCRACHKAHEAARRARRRAA